jgi:hypothetical protein
VGLLSIVLAIRITLSASISSLGELYISSVYPMWRSSAISRNKVCSSLEHGGKMLELNYNLKVITYLNFLVQDIKEFIY